MYKNKLILILALIFIIVTFVVLYSVLWNAALDKKSNYNLTEKSQTSTQNVLPDDITDLFPNKLEKNFLLENQSPLSGTWISDTQVKIQAKINGQVESLFVKNGDVVHAGQLLAIIKNEQAQERYQIQKLQQSNADLELKQLNQDVGKQRLLFAEGFISKAALEQIELTWQGKKNQQLQLMQQIQIERKNLGFQKLTAPTKGIISNVSVVIGDLVNNNTLLMHLIDQENMVWKTPVNSIMMAQLKPGQLAQINISSERERSIIPMKIMRIDPNQIAYSVPINNPSAQQLTFNGIYQGFVTLVNKNVSIAVSQESIYHDEQHEHYKKKGFYDFIMILDSVSQKTRLIPVKLGFEGIYQNHLYQEIIPLINVDKLNQNTQLIRNPWAIKENVRLAIQNL